MNFIEVLAEKLAPNLDFSRDATLITQKFGVQISTNEIKKLIIENALSSEISELERRHQVNVETKKRLDAEQNELLEKEKQLKAKYQESIESIKRVLEIENDEKIRNDYKTELALAYEKEKTSFLTQELKASRENCLATIHAFKGNRTEKND